MSGAVEFSITNDLPDGIIAKIEHEDGSVELFTREQWKARGDENLRASIHRRLERRQAEGREPPGSLEERTEEVFEQIRRMSAK